jgi:hypothetical protein
MQKHLSRDELNAGLPQILQSPAVNGEDKALVIRPELGHRQDVQSYPVSLAGGGHGDHWAKGLPEDH